MNSKKVNIFLESNGFYHDDKDYHESDNGNNKGEWFNIYYTKDGGSLFSHAYYFIKSKRLEVYFCASEQGYHQFITKDLDELKLFFSIMSKVDFFEINGDVQTNKNIIKMNVLNILKEYIEGK